MATMLTIITTTHNLYEKQQVDSFKLFIELLKLQTLKDIEHIVIDNNSTDGTQNLLQEYKKQGLLDFYSEADEGKFFACNKGIKKAKGKYISFMTSDDFYHDIMGLEAMINAIDMNKVDYSYSPSYCMHPQGFSFLYVPSIHNVFQVMPGPRQCMIFKKSLLEELGGFDTQFRYMADYDLMVRIMMEDKYQGIFVNRNYTTYRLGRSIAENEMASREEAKQVFVKNYSKLYTFNDELLDTMVNTSEFPQELLEKLSVYFPAEDKQLFLDRCEQMHKIRLNAINQQTQN